MLGGGSHRCHGSHQQILIVIVHIPFQTAYWLCGRSITKAATNVRVREGDAGQSLTPQERAQQLAEVALAVYEAGGCSVIHLPLEPSNPLLAILKQSMEREGSERAVGQALAHALLENVLQAVDEQTDSFPSLVVWKCSLLQP